MTSPAGPAAAMIAAGVGVDKLTPVEVVKLVVILSAAFMVVLDFFIVIVALPSIAASLHATQSHLQLIVAGYALANAATLIAGGRLGDLFGRRKMFIAGCAAFGLASVGCGLAPSATALVVLRFLQGMAGALLHPQVLALLGLHFTGPKRQKAFAWYAMSMGLAGISGQLLGGALVDWNLASLGWRSCFLINIPIALMGMLGAVALVDERGALGTGRVDFVGLLLAAAALLCLITPLSYGREHFDPAMNASLVLGAVLLGVIFWMHQRTLERSGGSPMLGPALFKVSGFSWGMTTVLAFYMGIASFYLILGLHLQGPLAMGAARSGKLFAIMGCSFFLTSLLGPRLQKFLGTRLLQAGALVLCAGHLLQAAAHGWQLGELGLVSALVVEGAGIGMVMGPLVSAVLARIPADRAGVAAGVTSTMQSAGNALGVAFVSSVYFSAGGGGGAAAPVRGFVVSVIVLAVLAAAVGVLCTRIGKR
jgi:MFS family permease